MYSTTSLCTEFESPFIGPGFTKATLYNSTHCRSFYPLSVMVNSQNILMPIQATRGTMGAFFFNRPYALGHCRWPTIGPWATATTEQVLGPPPGVPSPGPLLSSPGPWSPLMLVEP